MVMNRWSQILLRFIVPLFIVVGFTFSTGNSLDAHDQQIEEPSTSTMFALVDNGDQPTSETSAKPSNIFDACPEPDKELTAECRAFLDDHFLNHPIAMSFDKLQFDDWLTFGRRLTYKDLFDTAPDDLQRVFDALKREECRVHEREEINFDLYDECYAESFRNVHLLQINCSMYTVLVADRRSIGGVVYQLDESGDTDSKDYQLAKQVMWNVQLLPQWVTEQCVRVNAISAAEHARENGSDFYASMAARLGDRYALVAHKFFDPKGKYAQWLKETYPWLSDYRNLSRNYPIMEEQDTTYLFDFAFETYQARLVIYMKTMLALNKLNWQYDFDRFVTTFCTTPFLVIRANQARSVTTWSGDCSWLVYGLRLADSKLASELLPILDEFEQRATDLAVYHKAGSSADLAERVLGEQDLTIDRDYERVLEAKPNYPGIAQRMQIEGYVIVGLDVNEHGQVSNVTAVDSEPGSVFDQSAIDAVSMFRYIPMIQDGELQSSEGLRVRILFQLPD